MTELIKTKAKRNRDREDQRVAAEFRAMRTAYPDASNCRIIESLAASGNFKNKSFFGIRAALLRAGAITPKPRS